MKLGTIAGMPLEVEEEAIEKIVKIFVKELITESLESYNDEATMNKILETTMMMSQKMVEEIEKINVVDDTKSTTLS